MWTTRWVLAVGWLVAASCGSGYGGGTTPQDHGTVHVVRCKAAVPPPTLGAESVVFGSLMGNEVGVVGGMLSSSDSVAIGRLLNAGALGGGAGSAAGPPKVTVSLGTPSITGSLTPEAVARVLQHRIGELERCVAKHSQLLASGPAMTKAVVSWRFTIGLGGKVIQADATSHVLTPELAACTTAVVRAAAFPAPPDKRAVAVTLPIVFDSTGDARALVPEADVSAPWTPFATDSSADPASDVGGKAARATEGALRGRVAAIEACFAGTPVTGSVRAMLELDSDGELSAARAGGLGDKSIEACIENAVTGLKVVMPSHEAIEVACDLSRGDAQPWRVTTDREGYGLVEVSRARVRHGDQMLSAGEEPDTLTEHSMYVLVAEADTPGSMLSLAMTWTRDADATLVAVRPPGRAGAPPAPAQFLGMGRTSASDGQGSGGEDPVRPTLHVGASAVTACVSRATQQAKLADAAALGALAQKLATRCRSLRCTSSLVLAIDKDTLAKDLVEVVGAARRAGFERVLVVRSFSVDGEDLPDGTSCDRGEAAGM